MGLLFLLGFMIVLGYIFKKMAESSQYHKNVKYQKILSKIKMVNLRRKLGIKKK